MKIEIGNTHTIEVRKEQYWCNVSENINILYLSDFHFNGYSKNMEVIILDQINKLNPDIILMGGDYIDSKKGLYHLNTLMQGLLNRDNVFAIAGNHDRFFWIRRTKEIMHLNHINWIDGQSVTIKVKNTKIRIDGNMPQKQNSDADLSILCLHKPIDIVPYQHEYNLAFAGHLHGSQFVFWKVGEALYPGRLFYKWNILKANFNNCNYLVSKGLGDTLPIRYNCKRDMIFVTVSPIQSN